MWFHQSQMTSDYRLSIGNRCSSPRLAGADPQRIAKEYLEARHALGFQIFLDLQIFFYRPASEESPSLSRQIRPCPVPKASLCRSFQSLSRSLADLNSIRLLKNKIGSIAKVFASPKTNKRCTEMADTGDGANEPLDRPNAEG